MVQANRLGQKVGGHLALCCTHRMNQGELSQCFKHDDSTIKIVLVLSLFLPSVHIILMEFIFCHYYAIGMWYGAGLTTSGSNVARGCCVPTSTQRAIPPGTVNEYHQKPASKQAHHVMHSDLVASAGVWLQETEISAALWAHEAWEGLYCTHP